VRGGQTEGSVDLCRLAGLRPAAAIIEIMNEDGTMARADDLRRFCEKHELKMCSVADVIHHRLAREKLVERIAEAPFENELGQWRLIAYGSVVDSLPHVALVCGDVGQLDAIGQPVEHDEPVLVRMHSQNLLGDVFGDAAQPSHRTLTASMRAIQQAGRGAVVYLRHEMMGSGLLKRLQTLQRLGEHPPDDDRPRFGQMDGPPSHESPPTVGAYGIGCQILRDLGVHEIRLLTNHPFQPAALAGFDLHIAEFVAVEG
jgi:3,4-dihydroxy 2-butanone 4-phosphate synthase/GTP cyclohydrolase II